jgi:hypothetical protein
MDGFNKRPTVSAKRSVLLLQDDGQLATEWNCQYRHLLIGRG